MAAIRYGMVFLAAAMTIVGPFVGPAGMAARAEEEAFLRPNFFELDRIVVPVIHDRRLRGQIALRITLELEDDVDRERMFELLPRLRDRYLIELTRYVDRHPDIMKQLALVSVKALVQRVSDDVLGKKIVRAVLIQNASINRF